MKVFINQYTLIKVCTQQPIKITTQQAKNEFLCVLKNS